MAWFLFCFCRQVWKSRGETHWAISSGVPWWSVMNLWVSSSEEAGLCAGSFLRLVRRDYQWLMKSRSSRLTPESSGTSMSGELPMYWMESMNLEQWGKGMMPSAIS